MSRTLCVLTLLAAVAVPTALAQYPSEVVGFNGPPIDVPSTSQEMFRTPQFNSLSATFIVPNTGSNFDRNAAFRASGAQTEGDAALRVFFSWVNPANPDAWVRLTTFDGPVRPNPALNTEGKVRFKLVNISEFFAGDIGICLGIRETGTLVPQMANGGKSGDIEWVGVSTTPNGITAGADTIVDTTAAGDDVQVYPVGTNLTTLGLPTGTAVIAPGPNGVIDTTPAGDDQLRRGYTLDANGNRRPLPVAILPPSPGAAELEFNLATGEVKVNGVPQGGGIAGMTGDGDLNAPNNRGVLEHIAIVNVATDPAVQIDFSIDELQFESPTPDPIVPPRVQPIIVAGDTQVTVTDLVPQVNQVTLYTNNVQVGQQTVTPGTPSVVFTIAAAVTGDVYTATQRDTVNQVSDFSPPVTVVPFPPSYTFSILLDESGSGSCSFAAPGWEWVGVTSVSGFVPQGTPLVFRDAQWQTVDIPLNDPTVVRAGLGGNGALAPSPTGFYTMDSIWFTIVPNAGPEDLGPWEVLVDGVELLDGDGQPYTAILSMEDGVNRFPSARGQSSELPDSTALLGSGSYDGGSAHRLAWTYDNTNPTRTLGMLQRVGAACGTAALIPDTSTAIRFHLLCRGPRTAPAIPLPTIQAPVVGAQDTIVVDHDATATALRVYINGNAVGGPITPTGAQTTITGLALQFGDSVTVTQTLPAGTSDPAYPRAAARPLPPTVTAPIPAGATSINVTGLLTAPYATAAVVKVYANGVLVGTAPGGTGSANVAVPPQPTNTVIEATQTVNGVESFRSAKVIVGTPPNPPTVNPPLQAGDTTVKLTGVNPLATLVTVYAGNTPIGSLNPNGAPTVNVPVTPLVALDQISATASNVSGESAKSAAKEVGRGNGDVYLCIGIRETATTAPIGGNGGTTGGIEWLGSTTTGVPTGKPVTPSNSWQTITFDPATDPVRAFAGAGADGNLSSANGMGALEHIALTVNATSPNRSVGTYVLYVDNIVNVGAGPGGTDALVSDFEAVPNNTNEVMFRLPRFSGSTSANLEDPTVFSGIPNSSRSTDVEGNPGQSVRLSWYFRDTAANRWVRLTTFNAPQLPNPAINLTKPIRFQYLLQQILPPAAPTIVSPLQQGDTTVTVTNIAANSTLVQVFANNVPIGSVDPLGQATVTVPVTPLIHLDLITAVQSGPGGASVPSEALEVGVGNGDLLIALGIRETGDTGPLGSTGGTTGPLEWIGAAAQISGAPQGKPLPAIAGWQTVIFDPATDPVLNFFGGNGVIDGTRGVLEHVALAVNASSPNRSTGPYTIYIDNVVNVGAGPGGSDFVIADFESFAPGDEALFQPPNFSGTTDGNVSVPPNSAVVSNVTGNPGQSNEVQWFFKDTTPGRWIRLTTSGADNLSRPIIDLTRPIRIQLLLGTPGPALCAGDLNCDGQVDFDDIGLFVEALGYPGGAGWPYADCPWLNGDCNGNQQVDFDDIDPFVARIGASCE